MSLFPFTATNVIVGAALAYIKSSVSAQASLGGGSLTTTLLAPTSDAAKFSLGDQITIGSNTESPLITSINTGTGILTHDPVSATAVSTTVSQTWANLGATDGDILASHKIDITDQFVDQSIYPVDGVRTKGELAFRFPLADLSMVNVARAIGSPDSNVGTVNSVDTLALGTNENFRKDEYLVTGYGTNGKKRSWHIWKGASKSDMQAKHSKSNKQIINFDVTSYFDTATQSLGSLKQGANWIYSGF